MADPKPKSKPMSEKMLEGIARRITTKDFLALLVMKLNETGLIPVEYIGGPQRLRLKLVDADKVMSKDAKNLWDILSALRGPDGDANGSYDFSREDIKYSTTARIRAAIGLRGTGTFTVRDKPLTQNEQTHLIASRNKLNGHFWRHYYLACEAIKNIFGADLIHEGEESK